MVAKRGMTCPPIMVAYLSYLEEDQSPGDPGR